MNLNTPSDTPANTPPSESEPSPSTGEVVFLSGDLIFASRVRAAAENGGRPFRLSGNVPEDAGDAAFVVVDLSTRSKVVDGLMALCQQHCPHARVIAYAPHVQIARIKAAREAGIETVLTRGQFDSALAGLF
ncbi:hypothetical protein SAMN06265222_11396 [Neorhodopirellula lusitana]|uniref:Histidine kinase n=1 Tax=Neorhodopirellula lusitana TaxID=445327 RepID=A0ABY1QJP3_9BACT|nr:histidine kinase [Neorhodopirellula lusitana]SMP70645.1 hypothetical protein SAMN06265222_11396 [Neorhodopirellula lusitana]